MTVKELIDGLLEYPMDTDVCLYDMELSDMFIIQSIDNSMSDRVDLNFESSEKN
jgi:hypothetical protein